MNTAIEQMLRTYFQDQVEPYQKFFFICERTHSEDYYFKELIDLRK